MLRRSRLLDVGANCQSLAGLYNILYEREPCNNTVNWLLLSCALHNWIQDSTPDPSEILPTDARLIADPDLKIQVSTYSTLLPRPI